MPGWCWCDTCLPAHNSKQHIYSGCTLAFNSHGIALLCLAFVTCRRSVTTSTTTNASKTQKKTPCKNRPLHFIVDSFHFRAESNSLWKTANFSANRNAKDKQKQGARKYISTCMLLYRTQHYAISFRSELHFSSRECFQFLIQSPSQSTELLHKFSCIIAWTVAAAKHFSIFALARPFVLMAILFSSSFFLPRRRFLWLFETCDKLIWQATQRTLKQL